MHEINFYPYPGIHGQSFCRMETMYPLISKNPFTIMSFIGPIVSHKFFPKNIVKAVHGLGIDSSTEIINVDRLCHRIKPDLRYIEVTETDGRLYCTDEITSTECWLKLIPLAKDCQSCNVILMSTDKGVILKTVRNIKPGEHLLMWFTENVLAMMNMPFLTPSNIRGQNKYTCHLCQSHFEYPNPLKIHLALKCNSLDMEHLWLILAEELKLTNHTPFKFELTRISNSPNSSIQETSSSSTPTSPNPSLCDISPLKRSSAFKPYSLIMQNKEEAIMNYQSVPEPPPPPPPTQSSIMIPALRSNNDAHHAAQMETLVSNLGKSNRGHLCIYCGKIYSRKYGLKIHIRTHTGYKPLKCQYCSRPFGDPSNLNKHVRLHANGETPYKCGLCGKILVRRRDLERHIRSRHHGPLDRMSDTSSDVPDS